MLTLTHSSVFPLCFAAPLLAPPEAAAHVQRCSARLWVRRCSSCCDTHLVVLGLPGVPAVSPKRFLQTTAAGHDGDSLHVFNAAVFQHFPQDEVAQVCFLPVGSPELVHFVSAAPCSPNPDLQALHVRPRLSGGRPELHEGPAVSSVPWQHRLPW